MKITRLTPTEQIDKLAKDGVVYLYNEFEDCVLKKVKVNDDVEYYAKFRGEKQYSPSIEGKLIINTTLECNSITKEDYDSF